MIKVWVVMKPEFEYDEVRRLTTKQLLGRVYMACWSAILSEAGSLYHNMNYAMIVKFLQVYESHILLNLSEI